MAPGGFRHRSGKAILKSAGEVVWPMVSLRRVPGRPLALVGLLVAVAVLVVAQKGGEEGFIPEKQTSCWPCHAAWPTPLKSMYDILPPEEAGAPLGTPFEYTVRVRNPWLSDLVYFEPSLDLSDAPSLRFVSDQEPIEDRADGVIPVALGSAPDQPSRAFVSFFVPEGASSLAISLVPGNLDPNTGPDLTMRLYPGLSAPEGEPTLVVDNVSRGGVETFTVPDPAAFREQGLAYGNWTVEAEFVLLDPDADPPRFNVPQSQVPFEVDYQVGFELGDDPVQYLNRRATVDPDGSTLFKWHLQALAEPVAGEKVAVTVNATAYYKHNAGSSPDDYANFTKSMVVPVMARDGGAAIEPEGGIVVGAPPVIGVSLFRISEAVGYASAFLLVASVWTGGMFGKASRRQLNRAFGSAKRRVAFHNFLSYGLTAAALAHLVVFLVENAFYWTLGLIWGGLALLAMLGLGVTGAFQVGIIRRWNYGTWRWTHYGLAVAAIVFTIVHLLLDGANFGAVQDALGWHDPLDPRGVR